MLKKPMHRGDIWLVKLDPTVGTEISKTRPAIMVNDDAIGILPLKVIVPVTDWKDSFATRPWMVQLEPTSENGLVKTSGADTFQVRSVSESRLVKQLGKTNETTMQQIAEALAIVLGI